MLEVFTFHWYRQKKQGARARFPIHSFSLFLEYITYIMRVVRAICSAIQWEGIPEAHELF
jgi:hypothetical protein